MSKSDSKQWRQVIDFDDNDSLIDSLVTTWKPKGRELGQKAALSKALLSVPRPADYYSLVPSPIGARSGDQGVDSGVGRQNEDCQTGKTRHASPQAAWATLTAVVKHRHRKPKFWHRGKPGVYQCPFCHGWHTTSADRGEAA
ncbi:hypothetical protein [Pseudoxanthomonas sacheonensis]|uniref:hypothetical protein n=1 Tax=Pseudoxanthomonas sacheonensis TaxID=443615 RepID=UPI0013D1BE18|nr:hypothetical protein [Pseudoxanthomonas sacheonensis]